MKKPRLDLRIIKPADCVLAIAIPVSRQSFEAQLERPGQGKLVGGYTDWERYRRFFADRAATMLPRISQLGALVETNLTLDDFGRLLRGNPDVIILLAHWKEPEPGNPGSSGRTKGTVEFADGFAEVADIVARIPLDTESFIDLNVCTSEPLSVAIKRDRPLCLTHSMPKRRVTAIIWLTFYETLMHNLRQRDLTYLEAINDVAIEFSRQSHGQKA